MPTFRRQFSRSVPRTFRKSRFEWVYDSFNNVAPAAVNLDDLLGNFKSQYAIQANFPEMVVWRVHLRFSARITVGTSSANDGILITMFVDSTKQTIVNQLLNPNDEHYMIYHLLYNADTIMQGGSVGGAGAIVSLVKDFDVKSHRKLVNINDSLLLQTSVSGTNTFTDYSVSVGILLKMP